MCGQFTGAQLPVAAVPRDCHAGCRRMVMLLQERPK